MSSKLQDGIVRTTKIGASIIIQRCGREEVVAHMAQQTDAVQRLADAQRFVRGWNYVDELLALLNEMDEYLSPHPQNYIGCESILHTRMRELIAKIKE